MTADEEWLLSVLGEDVSKVSEKEKEGRKSPAEIDLYQTFDDVIELVKKVDETSYEMKREDWLQLRKELRSDYRGKYKRAARAVGKSN